MGSIVRNTRAEIAPGLTLTTIIRSNPTLHVIYMLTIDPAKRRIILEAMPWATVVHANLFLPLLIASVALQA